MQILFWRKIFEDGHCLSPGLFAAPAPRPVLVSRALISYVKPIKIYLAFEPRSGRFCQLCSQGKLTMPKNEIENFDTKT
jgi:hypothetical protein